MNMSACHWDRCACLLHQKLTFMDSRLWILHKCWHRIVVGDYVKWGLWVDGNHLTADLRDLYPITERGILGSKWCRWKVSEWPLAWACLTLGSRKECQHLDKYHRIKCTSSTWQDSSFLISDNVIKKKIHTIMFFLHLWKLAMWKGWLWKGIMKISLAVCLRTPLCILHILNYHVQESLKAVKRFKWVVITVFCVPFAGVYEVGEAGVGAGEYWRGTWAVYRGPKALWGFPQALDDERTDRGAVGEHR